jgi:hypothetical protein
VRESVKETPTTSSPEEIQSRRRVTVFPTPPSKTDTSFSITNFIKLFQPWATPQLFITATVQTSLSAQAQASPWPLHLLFSPDETDDGEAEM